MKRLLLLAVALVTPSDSEYEVSYRHSQERTSYEKLEEVARKSDAAIAKMRAEETHLAASLSSPSFAPANVKERQTRLEETRRILARASRSGEDIAPHLKQERALAAVSAAIGSDHRHPTRSDLNGSWSSAPAFTGYHVQLEQTGTSIVGQGYHWGCVGAFDPFKIRGSYRLGILTLVIEELTGTATTHVFRYSEENERPKFQAGWQTLEPLVDQRHRLDAPNFAASNPSDPAND